MCRDNWILFSAVSQYSHCWDCLSVVTRYKTLCHTLHVTRRRVTLCHVTRVIVPQPGPGAGTRQPHTATCHVMWGVWRVTVWQCDSWQPGDITTGRRGWRWVGQPLTEHGNNKHSSGTHIHTGMSQPIWWSHIYGHKLQSFVRSKYFIWISQERSTRILELTTFIFIP